jgi:transposase
MTEINTKFANWLLLHPNVNRVTSKIFKEFSDEKFPSAIINQTIRDVKSQKKHQQARTKRVGVPVVARPYQQKWLDRIIEGEAKQGTTKLYKKKRKWFMALPITFDVEESQGEKGMGIDLGLRYLAVASVGTKSLFFKGNRCASIRRRYAARRLKLGKGKKLDAIR